MTTHKSISKRFERGDVRRVLGEVTSFSRYRLPHQVLPGAVQSYLESLDSPRALTVWLLYKYEEHQQIVDLEFVAANYSGLEAFSSAYAATLFFSKYPHFQLGIKRDEVALEKLLLTEVECWKVNESFSDISTYYPLWDSKVVWLHDAVRRKIRDILGSLDIERVLDMADWGPGATQTLKRSEACSANKYQVELGITPSLSQIFTDTGFFSQQGFSPLWHRCHEGKALRIEQSNRVCFVPKSSKVDRSIAIEPGLNVWFQKGIGRLIRNRLRSRGVDLNDQSRNQRLACKGSLTDDLATIDFSSASDSISVELVRELLPPDWFNLLDTARSRFGTIPRYPRQHRWKKFSSMGNGFTFELESLIFYATLICCCEYEGVSTEDASVYGDDVIAPERSLPLFKLMCDFYGFKINPEKSFFTGAFRESCGEHYYLGAAITPIYLRDRVRKISDVYKLHNAICRRSLLPYSRDSRYRNVMKFLRDSVPKKFLAWVPYGLGDGGFVGNFDEACPRPVGSMYRFRNWEGYLVRHWTERSIPFRFSGEGLVCSSLRRLEKLRDLSPGNGRAESSPPFDGVDRSGFTRPVLTATVVSTWHDLGPWL